jgi:hypothetical protein
MICSKSFYENESIQSVVIENKSKLEGIESEVFKVAGLEILRIPNSVIATRFLGLYMNHGRNYHELKSVRSFTLNWLKSFFLHLLKSWMRVAFVAPYFFPR